MNHHRRSIRLPDFDYRNAGAYFVTMCAFQREHLFGGIRNGEMKTNEIGQTIKDVWDALPERFPCIALDELVIMPNHVHGILWIVHVGAGSPRPIPIGSSESDQMAEPSGRGGVTPPLREGSLGQVMAYWKYNSAKRIHVLHPLFGPVWQRNYYEHIIRDDRSLFAIRQYIRDNPENWETDPERNSHQTIGRGDRT